MATLKESADAFLAQLSYLFGLVENDLQVITLKGAKNRARTVGYYSRMSQFRTRCRVYVNVGYIREQYLYESDSDEEIRKTIAHGYAMSMLEAIKHVSGSPNQIEVPEWRTVFKDNEDDFAEDFARLCITHDAHQKAFWDEFMLAYAREHRRLFMT